MSEHHCGKPSAPNRTRAVVVLPSNDCRAQCPLGGVVVHGYLGMLDKHNQPVPVGKQALQYVTPALMESLLLRLVGGLAVHLFHRFAQQSILAGERVTAAAVLAPFAIAMKQLVDASDPRLSPLEELLVGFPGIKEIPAYVRPAEGKGDAGSIFGERLVSENIGLPAGFHRLPCPGVRR